MKIDLEYGTAHPLALDVPAGIPVTIHHGPEALADPAASLADALTRPVAGPPLAAHVVPGDRVVIALAGDLPGGLPTHELVHRGVTEQLAAGGVAPSDVHLLTAPPLALLGDRPPAGPAGDTATVFNPAMTDETAYLLADDEGTPLHLARPLVDADVVIAVGGFGYDAALGGRSPEGELWPGFGRLEWQQAFTSALLRSRRSSLEAWRELTGQVSFQLGIMASLRLVRGRSNSLAGISFGLPEATTAAARRLARPWRPAAPASDLTIGGISTPHCDMAAVTRAVAAAARTTRPGGTICIACSLVEPPGIVFTRWRQTAELMPLIREAAHSGDTSLITEALQTKLFARALGDRRLVLLSGLDQDLVEDLDIGHASSPEAIDRLMHQADSVTLLHEADRLCPKRVEGRA